MEQPLEKARLVTLANKQTNKEDKYVLSLESLGEGKSGKVYKATHVNNPDVIYAVKVVELSNDKVRKECLKELDIIKNLPRCPNLVFIHKDHFESEKNLYIFEEFCDSGSLADITTHNFTEAQVYDMFFQLVKGLIDLNTAGILHEDIKPANIMRHGKLYKYCDFGISELAATYKTTKVRKGTLSFMPPEKLKSPNYIPNAKSDIYSLGVTLYETIFGFHPYLNHRTKDYREYLKAIAEAQPKSINALLKHFPNTSIRFQQFLGVLQKMIHRSESKRISLGELEEELKTPPFNTMKMPTNSQISAKEPKGVKRQYEFVHESTVFYRRDDDSEQQSRQLFLPQEHLSQQQSLQSHSQSQPQSQSDSKLMEKSKSGSKSQIKSSLKGQLSLTDSIEYERNFLRDSISFMSRGLMYLQICSFEELNLKRESPISLKTDLRDTHTLEVLRLMILFYTSELIKCFHKRYLEHLTAAQEEATCHDIEYLKSQFLKYFTECQIKQKKDLYNEIKEVCLPSVLRQELNALYLKINCMKINFNEDMLAYLFLKESSQLLSVLEIYHQISIPTQDSVNGSIHVQNTKYKQKTIKGYMEDALKVVKTFDQCSVLNSDLLSKYIMEEAEKNGRQLLYDCEENSDEWELLEEDNTCVSQIQPEGK